MSWHCANGCGRTHDHDTVEPELCEVCEAVDRALAWGAHEQGSVIGWQRDYEEMRRERNEAIGARVSIEKYTERWKAERDEARRLAGLYRERCILLDDYSGLPPLPWAPTWDHDGSGDINSAAELEHYASGGITREEE